MDESLMEESKRIVNILVNIYNNGNKIDKPVTDYINTIIDSKYKKYEAKIMIMIIKLIPNDLYIASDNEHIFVKQDEFFEKN